MRKTAIAVITCLTLLAVAHAADSPYFYVYSESHAPTNHYIPSGYMGDYGDIKIDEKSTDNPKEGKTAIKVVYDAQGHQGAGWAGVYWQSPANNWGEKPGGSNLNGYTKLTFWARSGTKKPVTINEFKMGGITGQYADSGSAAIGPVDVPTKWTKYTIDLKGQELSQIIGGFCWATNHDVAPDGFTLYLDEIRYEK